MDHLNFRESAGNKPKKDKSMFLIPAADSSKVALKKTDQL
jgi:hypothetical protein